MAWSTPVEPLSPIAAEDPVVVVLGLGSLLACAAVLAGIAPRALMRGQWHVRRPRTALALWHALLLAGVACLVGSVVLVVVVADREGIVRGAWLPPTVLVLLGWIGLAALGGIAALILTEAEPLAEADRRVQAEFALLASRSTAHRHRGVDVVIVPSALPVALNVPGAVPLIVIASAMVDALTPDQLRAVIEHERAHVAQHHGLVMRLAQLNRRCFAFVPSSRELESSTRMLIELIADDAACRHAGAVHLANALLRIGTLTGDEAMLLRARRVAARPPHGSLTGSARLRRALRRSVLAA